MATLRIDLNCDMGESYGHFRVGDDAAIMPYLTSCNLACGFHGGDPLHIETTIRLALAHRVQIGAHPAYPDLAGFGRRKMHLLPHELRAIVKYQIAALRGMVTSAGGVLRHVKAHGALYNSAAKDEEEATAIAQAIVAIDPQLALVGPPASALEQAAGQVGLDFVPEAFADRRYADDGSLLPRSEAGSTLSVDEAVAQADQLVREGIVVTVSGRRLPLRAKTLCLHGDHPGAAQLAKRLRTLLTQ